MSTSVVLDCHNLHYVVLTTSSTPKNDSAIDWTAMGLACQWNHTVLLLPASGGSRRVRVVRILCHPECSILLISNLIEWHL